MSTSSTLSRQKTALLLLLFRGCALKLIAASQEWIDTQYLDNHPPVACKELEREGCLRLRATLSSDKVYELSEYGRERAQQEMKRAMAQ